MKKVSVFRSEQPSAVLWTPAEERVKLGQNVKEVQIEIPEERDNLFLINTYFIKYGYGVVARHLLTNNAEGWKHQMIRIAVHNKYTEEKQAQLDALLKHLQLSRQQTLELFLSPWLTCMNIPEIDRRFSEIDPEYDWANCTYKGEPHISMAKYCRMKFPYRAFSLLFPMCYDK